MLLSPKYVFLRFHCIRTLTAVNDMYVSDNYRLEQWCKSTHNVLMVAVTDTASPFSANTERCDGPWFSTGELVGGSLV